MDVQIDTLQHCTTSEPQFQASIDWHERTGQPRGVWRALSKYQRVSDAGDGSCRSDATLQRLRLGGQRTGDAWRRFN